MFRPRLQVIHNALVAEGLQVDRRYLEAHRYTGRLKTKAGSFEVAIFLRDDTLIKPPRLQLLKRHEELPDAVAHIEGDDYVCYVREPEFFVDSENVEAGIGFTLGLMKQALERAATMDLSEEIANEFPQTWAPHQWAYDADLWTRTTTGRMYKLGNKLILAESGESLTRFSLSADEVGASRKKALEVQVVKVGKPLTFAPKQGKLETFADFIAWADGFDPTLGGRVQTALQKQKPDNLTVFLAAPNGTVGATFTLKPLHRQAMQRPAFLNHLFKKHGKDISMTRISCERADEAFVIERNLAGQPSLANLSIALVGIGTIGSHLAKFLAQSGAGVGPHGKLTLFDEQTLSPGNIGRHLLSLPYVGRNKAEACADYLKQNYAGCEVNHVTGNAVDNLDTILKYKLVINATGEEGFSAVMNRRAFELAAGNRPIPPILYVWLKGLGVAAQGLLVDAEPTACFRCCIHQSSGNERFPVLKSSHPVALTPANCGEGAYFAYGVAAPAVAAGLGIQMAMDWAKGEPSPRFRTIRLNMEATQAVKDADPLPLKDCPVCGGR